MAEKISGEGRSRIVDDGSDTSIERSVHLCTPEIVQIRDSYLESLAFMECVSFISERARCHCC